MMPWWERPGAQKWLSRFMNVVRNEVRTWSKDPSTKVGATIIDSRRQPVSTGFNGLPMGVEDLPERLNDRSLKYPMTVHAEVNAVLSAGHYARGGLLVCTEPICAPCAGIIIQAGIRAVYHPMPPLDFADSNDWRSTVILAGAMFGECGVRVIYDQMEGDPPTDSLTSSSL